MTKLGLRDEITAAPTLSGDYLAKLTSRFVSVPSVNGTHPESALAEVVAAELEPAGFAIHRVGGHDRPSLAAVIGTTPNDTDRGLLLNGHLDTVPVDDPDEWRYPPFAGVIDGEAVHGRGACDMKGGLAVQVGVGQWLAGLGRLPERFVLHFAMGEERGEPGTESLIEAGFVAPMGVVLEPTDLQVGVAQRGLVTLRITILGRAGHASRRDLADNPVLHIPAILAVLDQLETDSTAHHELLGTPTWTPTSVHSGVIPSMIPGACDVLVDRRMLPGETVDGVVADLKVALGRELSSVSTRVEIVIEEGVYHPAEVRADGRMAEALCRAMNLFGEEPKLFGTPYSSDIRHLINDAGVEAVTFGPGRFSEMHARDEHIDIADLERGARAMAAMSTRLLDL